MGQLCAERAWKPCAILPFNASDPDFTLWSLPESARRIGITIRAAQRVLAASPAAFLDHGKCKIPLFAEKQLDQIARQIGNGTIRVRSSGLLGPKFGV
jgi:hypothetical protein